MQAGTVDVDADLVDAWSWVHLLLGAMTALIFPPFWALVMMVLWEPFELLVLSPILDKRGISFANETLANSLMDVVFDVAGVLVGVYVLRPLIGPVDFPYLPFVS